MWEIIGIVFNLYLDVESNIPRILVTFIHLKITSGRILYKYIGLCMKCMELLIPFIICGH